MKLLPWIIVVVLAVVSGLLGVNYSRERTLRILLENQLATQAALESAKKIKTDPQSQLKLLDAKARYSNGRYVVRGSLLNPSSLRFRSVKIIFNLEHNNVQSGQASATTYNLAAGQIWEFATYEIDFGLKISGEPLIEGEVAE